MTPDQAIEIVGRVRNAIVEVEGAYRLASMWFDHYPKPDYAMREALVSALADLRWVAGECRMTIDAEPKKEAASWDGGPLEAARKSSIG